MCKFGQPESKRAHLRVRDSKTPPKFHEKTPQEREERVTIVAGEVKKNAKCWGGRRRAVHRRRGPCKDVKGGGSIGGGVRQKNVERTHTNI